MKAPTETTKQARPATEADLQDLTKEQLEEKLKNLEKDLQATTQKNKQLQKNLKRATQKATKIQAKIDQERDQGTTEQINLKREIIDLANQLEVERQEHYEHLTSVAQAMNERYAQSMKDLSDLKQKYDTLNVSTNFDKSPSKGKKGFRFGKGKK